MISRSNRVKLALASLTAMAIGLAGCGGGDTNKADNSNTGDEVVKLTYMHRLPDRDGMTKVNDIVATWNKEHPNIQVTATKFDGKAAEMIKKVETDIKGGEGPDMFQAGYAEVPEIFNKGLLQDVTRYAEKYKDHFAAGSYNLAGVAGKQYGLPQDSGPLTYFYNKTEFEKLGLKVPTTKDELIEEAKTAAKSGKYIMSYQSDEAGNMLSSLAGAASPWYKVDGDAWVVDANGSGSKAVADVYQELLDNKAVATAQRWTTDFDAQIQDGSLIGTIAAAWEAPLFMTSDGGKHSGQWAVTQIGDWFGNGTKTGPDGGSAVVVSKNNKYPEQTVEFLDWFNTQVPELVSQGLVPVATTEAAKTLEDWAKFFGGQDIMAEFKTANDNISEFNYIPGFSAVVAKMNETAAKAVDGSGKVADVFADAQSTSIETLKNYQLSVKE